LSEPSDDAVVWSTDGTTFHYRAPLSRGLRLGDYVGIPYDGTTLLGELLTQRSTDHGGRLWVEGSGSLVTAAPDRAPFDARPLWVADAPLVEAAFARRGSSIELGTLRAVPDLPALLDARGFNRHTFLCGQSGSGKTYALGGLLEQLLLHTRLPLLVLDPNGDHVNLDRPRDDLDTEMAAAYRDAAADVRILRADATDGAQRLRVRFAELGAAGAAAVLELDPIADRREYNALIHALDGAGTTGYHTIDEALEAFRASGDDVLDAVRMRTENLGIDRMTAWAGLDGPGVRTLTEHWRSDRPRAAVADTSGFEERRERLAVTVTILRTLWQDRRARRPLLLVVDEAHDVCPAEPTDPLQALAVELFGRIAGEGRKYGIHLLLATQRPDKLPGNVLTQCDNLLLLRVNSAADRAALARTFAFVPPELVELSGTFGLGETLRAGRIVSHPQLARSGTRLTSEGGADVPTDWVG
jgi:DNA helicase HerA-like ATPase